MCSGSLETKLALRYLLSATTQGWEAELFALEEMEDLATILYLFPWRKCGSCIWIQKITSVVKNETVNNNLGLDSILENKILTMFY